MFAKRSVNIVPLFVAHERETGLFQACYKAEYRYKVCAAAQETLDQFHAMAGREQREALQRVTDELNATFKEGDLVRIVNVTHIDFDQIIVFGRVESWWLHDKGGSGYPLVSMVRVEDANQRYVGNGN